MVTFILTIIIALDLIRASDTWNAHRPMSSLEVRQIIAWIMQALALLCVALYVNGTSVVFNWTAPTW